MAFLHIGYYNRAVAEELLGRATEQLPSVSLPTIYAALALLEDLGHIRRVSALGGTTIYDTRRIAHHHVVCRVCGQVEDLEAGAILVSVGGNAQFGGKTQGPFFGFVVNAGAKVEIDGAVDKNAMGFAMTGPILRVKSGKKI